MPSGYRYLTSLLLAAAFLAPAVTTGCATRTYRTYDPYYNDYHRWDNHETVYYHQWVVENHRPDRDYRKCVARAPSPADFDLGFDFDFDFGFAKSQPNPIPRAV